MKKISLKDIANKVGVSTALVSYVLNNQKEGRIRKDVAQKIRDTAKQLNYRTNLAAKSLRTNKTFTIGLIVADISNPFFSTLARIVEDEADHNNYTVIFGSSDENPKKSEKLIDTLLNRQVDGLIIAPPADSESQIKSLLEQNVPFVMIDRYFPNVKASYVALDNYKAAFQAVQHFIDTGRKRIGMITFGSSIFNLSERTRGYLAALEENGISLKKSRLKKLETDNSRKQVEKAIDELISGEQPADAILFASNMLLVLGLKYINTLKIKVPDDLAIIGFDETEVQDMFYAPLTYIKQPLRKMGQLATRILLENIAQQKEPVQLNLEAELIIRESTTGKLQLK